MESLSLAAINKHDRMFRAATALANRYVYLSPHQVSTRLGWLARWHLRRSLQLLGRVLKLNPQNWSALWFEGKVLQRLGRHSDALSRLEAAHRLHPEQANIVREASLEAIEMGEARLAVRYCETAVRLRPSDPGLHANLALAFLINGDAEKAAASVTTALSIEPHDRISESLKELIYDVASGRRAWPRSGRELRGP